MDANGYLCSVAEPEQVFSVLLDGAVPMGISGRCGEYRAAGQREPTPDRLSR
ncbi:hypothetical protein ACVXG8_01110 [Escherichia coli]